MISNPSPLVLCRCCEADNLFRLFDKKTDLKRSFNLCLNCFNIQKEVIDSEKPILNNDHINPEWIHRYLYAKYGDGRLGLNLLEISSNKSRFQKFNDISIRTICENIFSITDDKPLYNFIIAENLLDTVMNPKKALDKISDLIDPTSGIAVVTMDTDIDKNISVLSAYSLSTLASRCGFGIIDVFKIRNENSEVIVAFLKKFEAHSKTLDSLIHEEESEGRYNIGSYYEDNYN